MQMSLAVSVMSADAVSPQWATTHPMSAVEVGEDQEGTLFVKVLYGSPRRQLTTRVELHSDHTMICYCSDWFARRGDPLCIHCQFVLTTCCKVRTCTWSLGHEHTPCTT